MDLNLTSATLSVAPIIGVLVELVVKAKVFVPVSNDGVDGNVESGINSDPITVPEVSVINLRLVTFAIALETSPLNCIFSTMWP